MRYGILGDIHANLSALEKVLSCMRAAGVDRLLSVGDVVGYGASPRECIQLLRELDAVVVKGNHDAACVGEVDARYFNHFARAAVEWTQSVLTPEDLEWLRRLPLQAELDHCTVVHATLHEPERFDYIQSVEDADPSLNEMTSAVCFAGHTHVPVTILRLNDDPRTAYTVDAEVELGEVRQAFCNVGSVGQPRDEDSRAAYAIFDSEASHLAIHRVEYDIAAAADCIRAAGLPDVLADRLFHGV
jgi:diadenosine tetraphosphatase ApaH/serine/threonine PP2A family protein phosphatase